MNNENVVISNNALPPYNFSCRFHPFDWFHEVGCPHMKWTKEELEEAKKVREDFKL